MVGWQQLTALPQVVLAGIIPVVCAYVFVVGSGGGAKHPEAVEAPEVASEAGDWGVRYVYIVLGWLVACCAVFSLQSKGKMEVRRTEKDEDVHRKESNVEQSLDREKVLLPEEEQRHAKQDIPEWCELLEDLKRENQLFRKQFDALNAGPDPEVEAKKARERESARQMLETARREILCLKENLKELQKEKAAAVDTVRRVVAKRPEFRGAYGDLHVSVPSRLGPEPYPEGSMVRHVLDKLQMEHEVADPEVCRTLDIFKLPKEDSTLEHVADSDVSRALDDFNLTVDSHDRDNLKPTTDPEVRRVRDRFATDPQGRRAMENVKLSTDTEVRGGQEKLNLTTDSGIRRYMENLKLTTDTEVRQGGDNLNTDSGVRRAMEYFRLTTEQEVEIPEFD